MKRRCQTIWACMLLSFLPTLVNAQNNENNRSKWASCVCQHDFRNDCNQPSCGVYAACRALCIEGIDATPCEFMTTEFISGVGGSSPKDLVKLVDRSGGVAFPMNKLSKLDVMLSGKPLIANIRSDVSAPSYDHWVCVFADGNQLLVFDGANGPAKMSTSEFLALWSGFGIFVSGAKGEPVSLVVYCWRFAVFGLIIGALWLVWSFAQSASNIRSYWLRFSTGVLVLAVTGVVLFGSPFDWSKGLRLATAPYSSVDWETVGLTELIEISANDNVVLISAQPAKDFERGKIDGAINIPHDVSSILLSDMLSDAERSTPIVVYCLSAKCSWDEILANKLSNIGFENIRVGDVGLHEYQQFAHRQR